MKQITFLLLVWISMQLVVISWVDTTMRNEIISNTFDCGRLGNPSLNSIEKGNIEPEKYSHWGDIVFPLSHFFWTPNMKKVVNDYCFNKK